MRKLIFTPLTIFAAALLAGCGSNDTFSNSAQAGGAAFSLAANPPSNNVAVGDRVSFTVTATSMGGFANPVDLSVSGVPAGAAATFNTTTVTPTSNGAASTLTVDTNPNRTAIQSPPSRAASKPAAAATNRATRAGGVQPGTYTLTIAGSGGGITRQTTVQLVVTAAGTPTFTLTAAPSIRTITAGQSTTYTATLTAANGFNSPVTLAAAGLPAGATASFNPASVTPTAAGATSTVTVQTGSSTPAVTSTLTISGTGGSATAQTTVQLVVQASSGGAREQAIYVADSAHNRVARMNDMSGANIVTFGTLGSGAGQFHTPYRVVLDNQGRIYVDDSGNNRIVRMDNMTGAGWVSFGTLGSGTGQFNQPFGLFVDQNNRIYVADTGNGRIVRIDDMTGAGWTTYGVKSANPVNPGELKQPYNVFVTPSGRIYIPDGLANRVVRVDDMTGSNFVALKVLTGIPSPTGLGFTTAVVEAPDGKIYIGDNENRRLIRIDDMTGANPVAIKAADLGIVGNIQEVDIRVPSDGLIYFCGANQIYRIINVTGAGLTTFDGTSTFLNVTGMFVVPAP